MNAKRIKKGEWYQTKYGIGKCLANSPANAFRFLIDGKEMWIWPKEVQHEIAKGQEPKHRPDQGKPGRMNLPRLRC